jgi:N6-adenosine-specific RNA methylase IME4
MSTDPRLGRYGVIIADPPWDYSNSACEGAAEKIYPTMTLGQLLALPVPQLTADDCVLLMWATWPKLDEACLPLLRGWGFQYVTGFPWVKVTDVSRNLWGMWQIKVPYGVGFWARGTTEIVLIGKRGSPKPPPNGFIGLLSPNLYHSRKPESLYDYAESMPGPYLEMFARRNRPGWDVWGNEVVCDVQLSSEVGA